MEAIMSFLAVNFDLPILEWIQANLQCGFLDFIMPIITLFGEGGIFWIAWAVVLLFIPKYRKVGWSMGVALILGLLVCNVTLKPLVHRPRPYDFQLTQFGKEIQLLIAARGGKGLRVLQGFYRLLGCFLHIHTDFSFRYRIAPPFCR